MHSVTHFMDRKTLTALAVAFAVSIPATASADDLDVYTGKQGGGAKPNILLVLDFSGSMEEDVNGNDTSVEENKKINILRSAVNRLMDKYETNINLGLGALYDTKPSGVRWPISDLTDHPSTVDGAIPDNPDYSMKEIINAQMDDDRREAAGYTNTVSALADAALYFQGGPVTHNDASLTDPWNHKPDKWNDGIKRYEGGNPYSALPVSYDPPGAYDENASEDTLTTWCRNYQVYDITKQNYCEGKAPFLQACTDYPLTIEYWDHDDNPDTAEVAKTTGGYESCEYKTTTAWTQPTYISPITHECQKNFMILISDGLPTQRTDGATLKNVLDIAADQPIVCEDVSVSIFNDAEKTSGNCGAEILFKLANENQVDGIDKSTVSTYTIGFSVSGEGGDYLDKLARAGNGKFLQANNADALDAALDEFVDQFLLGNENFTELSIDLDRASFSHDNRAYFSLFKPSYNRAWSGNVKGYFIDDRGLVDINNNEAIVVNDEGKTQFAETAHSFWSSTPDGNEAIEGGASAQMILGDRNLYTFTGDTNNINGEDLTLDANALHKVNKGITQAMLNNPADRDVLLDWLQTAPMGDALHSKVVTANYGDQTVAYIITNQGFLHAIDATTPVDINAADSSGGDELFAFMPQELLANLPALKDNKRDPKNHIYGLDGQITPVHTDTNDNGIVDDGEKLVLVFGMRRGGNNYYAVNVSKPYAPKLEWQIKGGEGDFNNLAQTWSRMSLISGSTGPNPEDKEQVLAFAGGYDAKVVDNTDGDVKANGNAIYVIDLNGKLLWSTEDLAPNDMEYSIPSDLTVIDTDGDKKADRMYVGDTRGNVWRVDFDRIRVKSDYDVIHFANLKNSFGDTQPFFYPPSIAHNRSSEGDFLSVSIASGNRTNPLNLDEQNAIYMMRDEDTQRGATTSAGEPIELNKLYNATANDIASSDPDVANEAKEQLSNDRGWYINLRSGEKGLSALLSFEGNLMATTYQPTFPDEEAIASDDDDNAACKVVSTGALYIMDISDGRPVKYLADGTARTEGLLASDRVTPLTGTGIPSSPQIMFPKGSSQVNIIVDKESISTVSQRLNTVFWHGQ